MPQEDYVLKLKTFLAASTLALLAFSVPAIAQHSMTPEQKAAAAAAKAAAETPAVVEAAPEVDPSTIDTSERTIWDGVFTAEQAAAGAGLYTTNCAGCHGKTGRGSPGGPGITGANLNKKWEEISLLDFYTFAHTKMPPGKAGTIGNEQDYVNIVAYILDLHGAEPGDSQLVYNEEQLGNIYIVRKPK